LEWVSNERKNGIANKLQMDLKNVNPNGGNVEERNPKSMQFFFLGKLLKLSPQTRFRVFFPERDAFSARKTSLFISFTSLIQME
jgi:hypothetical protein